MKVDIFELEDSKGKVPAAWVQPANCRRVHAFLEGNPRQHFEPNGATLISHLAKDWMQHFPQFLISDPGGCFVSNELRDWASIRVVS